MGKKLAIIGHPTRGEEVIKLLEMVGGKNCYNLSGLFTDYGCYFIGEPHTDGICGVEYIFSNEDICLFTLEEFFEKYPFKVGDKVVYTKFGDNCDDYPVTIESMKWTGTTIEYTFNDCVTCLAKDLKMWKGNPDAVISGIYLNSCDYADEVELNLGDYEIEVRDGKTYAVKKKSKYPKNCSECENVLGIQDTIIAGCLGYEYRLMNNFQRLFMCRNAYWKIAGEQMGLGKPWEPDWEDETQVKYMITTFNNKLEFFSSIHSYVVGRRNHILSFPTEEMRDAFYENFKDLIESCKELL
jgi:hypothetical protein